MATTTPINALPTPDDSSPNDPPIHFAALNNQLDTRLVAQFATTTARNNAITTPVEGMACVVAGNMQVYRAGAWHGVSPISYLTLAVDSTLYTTSHAIMTLNIPDPTYPYRLNVGGAALLSVVGVGVGIRPSYQVNGVDQNPIGNTTFNGGSTDLTNQLTFPPGSTMTGVLSGPSTVTFYITKVNGVAGNGYKAEAGGVYGILWASVLPV